VTVGVALSPSALVVGVTFASDLRGHEPMDAALAAHESAETRYAERARPANDVTDALESHLFVLGVSTAVVAALRREVSPDQQLPWQVLAGVRSIGHGTGAGEAASTTLVLAYDAGEYASPETVRSFAEKMDDGDDVGDDDTQVRVSLARAGRVVLVETDVAPSELVVGLDRLPGQSR